jgi:hypothetical protein
MPQSNMGLKTIWITLRAVNYTSMVFRDAIQQVDTLSNAEKKLAKQTIMAGQHALMSGMMWITLGQSMDDSLTKSMAQVEIFQQLQKVLTPVLGQLITLIGAMQVVIGIMNFVTFATSKATVEFLKQTVVIHGYKVAFWQLGLAIAGAFALFTVMYEITKNLPAPISILTGVILALAAAIIFLKAALGEYSFIASLALAGGAIGAMYGAYSSLTSHQMGTRMVAETGPSLVHKGEVIYNPSTHRPTQVGNDLEGTGTSTTIYQMPMTIKEMNTKASFDDVDDHMRRSVHRVTRNNRR